MYYRNLLICSSVSNPEDIIDVQEDILQKMKEQLVGLERFEIMAIIKELSSLEGTLKWSAHPRILLEAALIKLCEGKVNPTELELTERIQFLEKRINEIMEKGIVVSLR